MKTHVEAPHIGSAMKNNLIVLIVILSGCIVNAPLVDVTYDGAVASASKSPVLITLTTGDVEGSGYTYVIPGTVVPLENEPHEEYQFNLRDQIAFREFLSAELSRAGVFAAFTDPDGNPLPQHVIDVAFQRTSYSSASSTYELDVLLSIRSGDEILQTTDYHLKDKMTFSNTMWHGDPAITKNRIATTLLTQIIQDIDAWSSGTRNQAESPDAVP